MPRAPLCEALEESSFAEVLGGNPERSAHYKGGQRRLLAPGLRDVAHEHSCTFERGRRTARAWVFAQPAFRPDARDWRDQLLADRHCDQGGGDEEEHQARLEAAQRWCAEVVLAAAG